MVRRKMNLKVRALAEQIADITLNSLGQKIL